MVDDASLSNYRLPRGRHGMPAEEVAENQRWRLLAAVAEVLGEKGYARIRSADVAARASVSRATFYEHFENVSHCILVAYETAADCVLELAADACETDGVWQERVALAITTIIGFLAAEPAFARLLGTEAAAGVPAVAAARIRLVASLAALLRENRLTEDAEASRRSGPEVRFVEGALVLVGDHLKADEAARLPGLAPELTRLFLDRLAS